MRNPLLHNLLIDHRCVSSHDGRSRPVRQNRRSLAHPSLHNCSLRPYRSIATPIVWIPTAKSMKQNTGKASPTAANDCWRGAYGSFRFRKRPLPRWQEQSHWLTPREPAAPIEEFVDLAARHPAGLVRIWSLRYSGQLARRTPNCAELPLICGNSGAPGRIRTCGLLLRRQTLYPLSYGGACTKCCANGPRQTNSSRRPPEHRNGFEARGPQPIGWPA